jgi:hypothetical protein
MFYGGGDSWRQTWYGKRFPVLKEYLGRVLQGLKKTKIISKVMFQQRIEVAPPEQKLEKLSQRASFIKISFSAVHTIYWLRLRRLER